MRAVACMFLSALLEDVRLVMVVKCDVFWTRVMQSQRVICASTLRDVRVTRQWLLLMLLKISMLLKLYLLAQSSETAQLQLSLCILEKVRYPTHIVSIQRQRHHR